jgi:hypothetical protein
VQEPGEPQRPEELPGHMPDELPVRGPQGPSTPQPAADPISGLKWPSECVMNGFPPGLCPD